jgi:uncharacterized heparinase superfamily protein
MAAVPTWWRTVRHLKWQQVVGRALHRLPLPTPDTRQPPPRRTLTGAWSGVARRGPSLTSSTRFRFLNITRDIAGTRWNPSGVDRLWSYNLHYFDDLNALDARTRESAHRALIADWIAANPPSVGTGWEPYPVSLRVVNWIKWFLAGVSAEDEWIHSLAVQARWLRRRIEHHLLGNHLLANAKGLIFAGVFFEGPEADEWLRRGLAIFAREIEEQVLRDGGHFERSPMYHALVLEDVLDLINICATAGAPVVSLGELRAALWQRAPRMLEWLRCMVHPSGQLGQFNDCADGVAPPLTELEQYAARLGVAVDAGCGEGIRHLDDSGYVRVGRGRMTAILDVGKIGPDYLPAHAHADTLSFEVSLGDTRVLANGGTSCYGSTPRRSYERGTSAHTTVEVNGENSSEVWHSFRVGRRAHPEPPEIGDWQVRCSHDGYRFLKGKPIHRRTWAFSESAVTVDDEVSPAADACARYFVAPELALRQSGDHRWRIVRGETALAELVVVAGRAGVARCPQAQRFGVIDDVDCLVVELVDGRARTTLNYSVGG